MLQEMQALAAELASLQAQHEQHSAASKRKADSLKSSRCVVLTWQVQCLLVLPSTYSLPKETPHGVLGLWDFVGLDIDTLAMEELLNNISN